MAEARVLVVDDEYLIRWTLQQKMEKAGYEVFVAETGEEGIQKIKEEAPDIVLLDIKMPGMDGYEVLGEDVKIDPGLVVIMITAYDDIGGVVRAMRLGAFDYIIKPFDFDKILISIQKSLETSKLRREVERLRKDKRTGIGIQDIVAVSKEMARVFEMVEKIARSETSTVLIQGESGTGKER